MTTSHFRVVETNFWTGAGLSASSLICSTQRSKWITLASDDDAVHGVRRELLHAVQSTWLRGIHPEIPARVAVNINS